MKLPTLDGWLSWSFDDIAYSQRTDKNSVYKFQIKKRLTLPVGSYYEEIYNNQIDNSLFWCKKLYHCI